MTASANAVVGAKGRQGKPGQVHGDHRVANAITFLGTTSSSSWDARAAYQSSMAGPALNADGLDNTALQAPKAKLVRTTNDAERDPEYVFEDGLDGLIIPDVGPGDVVAHETSMPIEIFEGVVVGMDQEDSLSVTLRPTYNRSVPEQTMELDRSLVQPQDRDLVSLGAVFYLSMYRQTTGNTVKNSEDVTFRRRPDWNALMFKKLAQLAAAL